MKIGRRTKEQPSVYRMTHRAARLGYTLVESFSPAPTFTATYTIYAGWPNGTAIVKTLDTPIQVYKWLSREDSKRARPLPMNGTGYHHEGEV